MDKTFKLTIFSLIIVFAIVADNIFSYTKTAVQRSKSTASAAKSSSSSASTSKASTSSRKTPTTRQATTQTKTVTQIAFSNISGQTPLDYSQVSAGKSKTIGDLFNFINTNDAANKRARFQVYVPGTTPKSVSCDDANYGLSLDWINANAATAVTMQLDSNPQIITNLTAVGAFPRSSDIALATSLGWGTVFQYTIDNFYKILLYFTIPGFTDKNNTGALTDSNGLVKFYLVDTWPQSTSIVWNAGFTPEQACRPYRLLMDWKKF